MNDLFDLENLQRRLSQYVRESLGLAEYAAAIPVEVLRRGELARGEAARITGRPERTARAAMSQLLNAGLLESDTAKSPVRLRFSADSADVLFPRLFGAQVAATRVATVNDTRHLWDQVRTAARTWVSRSLVCIVPQRVPEVVSSGTAVRTPGGRVVVLTAWHCVDDLDENPPSITQDSWPHGVQRALTEAIEGPDGCDIAIAIPSAEAHEVLVRARCTIESASVATVTDDGVDSSQWLLMGGYPAELASVSVDHGAEIVTLNRGSMIYTIPSVERDALRSGYRIPWVEDAEAPLPRPQGISGGPLWRVDTETPQNEIWTPEKRLKLIGVATSYLESERIEFAESVAVWGDWFRETIAALDKR